MQEDVILLSDLRAQLPVIGDSAIQWDNDHDPFTVGGVVLRKSVQASRWLVEDQDTSAKCNFMHAYPHLISFVADEP